METPAVTRRKLVIGGACLALGPGLSRTSWAQAPAVDYAVFTEFSPQTKPMKPGWNRRIFTDTDAQKGSSIRCDFATGIVSLVPGLYHLSGLSTVAYDSGNEPPETTTVRAPAAAGYCRLRSVAGDAGPDQVELHAIDNADPGVICLGSTATANMTPSLFEAYYETTRPTRVLLEHQCGSAPRQIYLRVFAQNSKWHAFARLAVRRLQ